VKGNVNLILRGIAIRCDTLATQIGDVSACLAKLLFDKIATTVLPLLSSFRMIQCAAMNVEKQLSQRI
jgi:hypothetical protein